MNKALLGLALTVRFACEIGAVVAAAIWGVALGVAAVVSAALSRALGGEERFTTSFDR